MTKGLHAGKDLFGADHRVDPMRRTSESQTRDSFKPCARRTRRATLPLCTSTPWRACRAARDHVQGWSRQLDPCSRNSNRADRGGSGLHLTGLTLRSERDRAALSGEVRRRGGRGSRNWDVALLPRHSWSAQHCQHSQLRRRLGGARRHAAGSRRRCCCAPGCCCCCCARGGRAPAEAALRRRVLESGGSVRLARGAPARSRGGVRGARCAPSLQRARAARTPRRAAPPRSSSRWPAEAEPPTEGTAWRRLLRGAA